MEVADVNAESAEAEVRIDSEERHQLANAGEPRLRGPKRAS